MEGKEERERKRGRMKNVCDVFDKATNSTELYFVNFISTKK